MFSFSYLFGKSMIILRHPSSIVKLFRGFDAAGLYVDRLRDQKFTQCPIIRRRVHGFYINLNSKDKVISSPISVDGCWEREETELVRKLLRKGMVFVDIGANIGWYTLISATIVGDKGIVIAYEPEPTNFSLLSKSQTENDFKNIKAFQQCVSENTMPKTLWLSSNPGLHSIIKSSNDQGISVSSTTLDISLKNLGIRKIDLLKIDVEGAEPQVIEGARQTLAESRIQNIIMEWNREAWLSHTTLLEYLFNTFDVYQIVKSPFLIKHVGREDLYHLPQVNLFFHLSTSKSRKTHYSRKNTK